MFTVDKVHQKYKIYAPIMKEYAINPYYPKISDFDYSNCEREIEYIGTYKDFKEWRGYDLGDRSLVTITRKVLETEEKVFDFISTNDVLIGSKIEIDGEEYSVTDKKYQLDGVIDYYVQDRFIKCENYEEQYKEVKEEVKTFLLDKRELEDKHREQVEPVKKKSIWWYFGIR